MSDHPPTGARVLFINQVCGPLFRELAEDVARELGSCEILTGTPLAGNPQLRVLRAPAYDRASAVRRIWTWLAFGVVAFFRSLPGPRSKLLFLVSNPPFLGLIGWLVSLLTGRRYVVLIYDLYPGMLENLGRLRRGGLLARLWHGMNRLVWGRAACVITIGEEMAANIRPHLRGPKPTPLVVIPNWADSTFLRPRPKAENPFAQRLGEVDKLTILYSGNLGHSHDLTPLLDVAREVREEWKEVSFLIIGGGVRYAEIEERIRREALTNVRLLPLQPEQDLPYTLTTGDVAVVTYEAGAEGYMVPSKSYYYLAAGCALLVLASGENSISRLANEHGCGISIMASDGPALKAAIARYRSDRSFLQLCRTRARTVQETLFSRRNAARYVEHLRRFMVD